MDAPRYNFIIPRDSGFDLQALRDGDLADFAALYARGEYCWGLQTFKVLRDSGLNLGLSFDYEADAINLAHGNVARSLKPRWNCFLVSLQADYPSYPLARYHIVQNGDQAMDQYSYVPHWPQLGQISRAADRSELEVVAYQGRIGFSELNMDRLEKDLRAHGMTFRALGEGEWTDLSAVDALIGIRGFSKKLYRRKPPSKLTNAWSAGIPFVGGWDSAFSRIGTPGGDYLRVSSYDELLAAVVQLKDDPVLYTQLVERGRQKAPAYTFEAIAADWAALLGGEVLGAYEAWRSAPGKRLRFGARRAGCGIHALGRSLARSLYSVPILRELRHRHFDPVN